MTTLADLISGSLFGDVYPAAPLPPFPDKDAREYVLEQLAKFIGLLVFRRTMEEHAPPHPFQLQPQNIWIYQPDDVRGLGMPSLGIIPALGVHEPYGLGPPTVLDETADLFGPGMVLVRLSEYTEKFAIEVRAAKHAELRSLVAGLKSALRLDADSYALRLKLPGYYDEVGEVWLEESQYIDVDDVVRNRRPAQLHCWMRVPELQLVPYRRNQATAVVEVCDGQVIAQTELVERHWRP